MLVGGLLRSLPVLALLASVGLMQMRRRMTKAEAAAVYAMVAIAIPWSVSIKACIESSVSNLLDSNRRQEKMAYQWAKDMPWWAPTLQPPAGQAENEARVLAALAQAIQNDDEPLRTSLLALPPTMFYYNDHRDVFAPDGCAQARQRGLAEGALPPAVRAVRARGSAGASCGRRRCWRWRRNRRPCRTRWRRMKSHEPQWVMLDKAIEGFSRGAPDGAVPWRLWWRPMLYWAGMCGSYIAMLFGLLLMFRRRWIEHERLPFPWAMPALSVIQGQRRGPAAVDRLAARGGPVRAGDHLRLAAGRGRSRRSRCCRGPATKGRSSAAFDLSSLGLLYKTSVFLYWCPLILVMYLLLPTDVLLTIVLTYVLAALLGQSLLLSLGMDIGKTMLEQFPQLGHPLGRLRGPADLGPLLQPQDDLDLPQGPGRRRQADPSGPEGRTRPRAGQRPVPGGPGGLPLAGLLLDQLADDAVPDVPGSSCTSSPRSASGPRACCSPSRTTSRRTSWSASSATSCTTTRTWWAVPKYPDAVATGNAWGVHWMAWAFAGQLKTFGPQNMLMEIFKIAHEVRANIRQIGLAILLAVVVVALLTPPLYVKLIYLYGFENTYQDGWAPYSSFTQWSERACSYGIHSTSRVYINPGAGNWFMVYQAPIWMAVGIAIVGVLTYLRREYVWFPLSPVGFVLAGEVVGTRVMYYTPDYMWFTILLAWVIKKLVFRWLGRALLQRADAAGPVVPAAGDHVRHVAVPAEVRVAGQGVPGMKIDSSQLPVASEPVKDRDSRCSGIRGRVPVAGCLPPCPHRRPCHLSPHGARRVPRLRCLQAC